MRMIIEEASKEAVRSEVKVVILMTIEVVRITTILEETKTVAIIKTIEDIITITTIDGMMTISKGTIDPRQMLIHWIENVTMVP